MAHHGLCRPVLLDADSSEVTPVGASDRNALETADVTAQGSADLENAGRELTTHWDWPVMNRPNDRGIYYRLEWISRSYTDDIWFVDGCSSPTSMQYMKELNPICNAHDLCYRCRVNWGISTKWCDDMLLRRCKDVCHANWPGFWDSWHRGWCQATCDTMASGLSLWWVRSNNEKNARRTNDCRASWRPYLERPFTTGRSSNQCNKQWSC
ncbi:hypothetical protein HXX76_000681 [Chlamydomonas incerta]|uniref:Uncharacterized protein n=1 Tax=Chlamydomonas incerta TaxID=51695 RepID=A0A835WET1_CHLIN|nr:hypothetical protein HXX76_000681 [Chlamydomonas incerta]|eukprot:KAG2446081.1 hypothetical protein HXX76_000681 [Chlamydomonas incerta]